MPSKKPRLATKANLAIFITLLLATAAALAQAQTFKVLYTFHGPNGAFPEGPLALDKQGNIYGTAVAGGADYCDFSFDDKCGIAYKLDKSGKQVWIHSFNGADGEYPADGLLLGTGGLYGTTNMGGSFTCSSLGCGTVVELNENGKEKLLYQFGAAPDAQ